MCCSERQEDDGAGDLSGVEQIDEFFNRDDGGVFGAVGAGDKSEDKRSTTSTAKD
jgi:hypothetical protein